MINKDEKIDIWEHDLIADITDGPTNMASLQFANMRIIRDNMVKLNGHVERSISNAEYNQYCNSRSTSYGFVRDKMIFG